MRLDNNRLTLLADELKERNRFLERKYFSLVERCGASQEDLEAVEVMMAGGIEQASKNGARSAKYPKELAQQRDR